MNTLEHAAAYARCEYTPACPCQQPLTFQLHVAALPLPCDTNFDMDIDDPSELKTTHDLGSVILAILLYIKNTKILPNQLLKETWVNRQGVIPQDVGTVEQPQTTYSQDLRILEQAEIKLSLLKL